MPRARKKKIVKAPPAGRLDIVIDPELKEWAKGFARRKHTSLTAIIIRHLVELQEGEHGINVEQI